MSDDKISIGRSSAALMPNRYADRPVDLRCALPGTVILVHGVNDTGTSFYAMENGLCQGLNERLDRLDLFPGDYTLPKDGDKVIADPDKVYFRRNPIVGKTHSPVIPFYWGYRASKNEMSKKKVNGQNVDIHGNRLDKDFAKGGGMFGNATNNIPDMFGAGFKRTKLVAIADTAKADPYHTLLDAADRRYMVLAAKRLAMLVAQIRAIHADETVTLVGHSQGCLISLLAQAYLKQDGKRPADCLILTHPPYSLEEPVMERDQSGSKQQTKAARLSTLKSLVGFVTGGTHQTPPLPELADTDKHHGRAGPKWKPNSGTRADLKAPHAPVSFKERDNRGKVYLYFCPEDQTVGLKNVQGIGALGVPDAALKQLGPGFLQRVWTWKKRNNAPVRVGERHAFKMLEAFELSYPGATPFFTGTGAGIGETRHINGEALNPALIPDLHYGESSPRQADPRYQGKQAADPIDAGIAAPSPHTHKNLRSEMISAATAPRQNELQAQWNQQYPGEDQHRQIAKITPHGPGTYQVWYQETNDQLRQHLQDNKQAMDNSYHGAIVGNPEHHRWVTAMDVALGQSKGLDDPEWGKLLCAIADWRTLYNKDKKSELKKYNQLTNDAQALVEATHEYYKKGAFPDGKLVPLTLPPGVVSEAVATYNPYEGAYASLGYGRKEP